MSEHLKNMTHQEKTEIATARKKVLYHKFISEMPLFKKVYDKVPTRYQILFLKVVVGDSSSAEKIKLKCLECNGYYKEEIDPCPDRTCALWGVRPYQRGEK